ncbi:NADH dehydrogenase [ubiquinone] 1 alpha subcomplex subunit 4 [Camponotus floridanus]|uniref:NADH dehydrogenase [ubiquinone] 1 alpha subcomplex subunit 4 n=1 Tax=Camponotus floridanus TaxID=104421 RepID=E2A493_CAMFO|nr:cytochrome c oxidase subunit NDUFA4 [Camponotus floridanus]EFN71764.1 NADH dehydrogenase [ubiquinone] 1 alpha subcomplex subunit 4 [Camponotus floridanus]
MKMQGTTMTSLKKNPALFPLYLCIAVGGAGALFYTLRLALRNPDVSWLNKKEAEPWNYYKDKHYKFYASSQEVKDLKSPAPEY